MGDIKIIENSSSFIIEEIEGKEVIIRLKDYLPSDRVITVDSNNYVYLYDKCFKVIETDIEEVL